MNFWSSGDVAALAESFHLSRGSEAEVRSRASRAFQRRFERKRPLICFLVK